MFEIIRGFRAAHEIVVEFRRRVSEDMHGRILHQRALRSGPQHRLQT